MGQGHEQKGGAAKAKEKVLIWVYGNGQKKALQNYNNNNILRFTRCANLNKIIKMLLTELYTLTLSRVN